MYNAIAILFFIFLSGCVASVDYSQPTSTTVQAHGKNSSLCQKRNIDISKVLSTKKVLSEFRNVQAVEDITEFETSDIFKERVAKQLGFFTDRVFLVYVQSDQIFSEIKYDVYMNRFIFKIKNYPAPIYSSYARQEPYPSNVLIDSDYKAQGSYLGANAFGAVARVEKGEVFNTVLNITNISNIYNYNGVDTLHGLLKEIYGSSLEISPATAERIKKDLRILCEFSPSAHYVNTKRFGVFDKTKKAEAPTLSSPYATTQNFNVLFVNIKGFYLVNTKTGEVFGGVCF